MRACSLAESLGGVETLISHPATMTHAALGEKGRREIGITDGLVRISVGIENVEDIMDDLDRALASVLETEYQFPAAVLVAAGCPRTYRQKCRAVPPDQLYRFLALAADAAAAATLDRGWRTDPDTERLSGGVLSVMASQLNSGRKVNLIHVNPE